MRVPGWAPTPTLLQRKCLPLPCPQTTPCLSLELPTSPLLRSWWSRHMSILSEMLLSLPAWPRTLGSMIMSVVTQISSDQTNLPSSDWATPTRPVSLPSLPSDFPKMLKLLKAEDSPVIPRTAGRVNCSPEQDAKF